MWSSSYLGILAILCVHVALAVDPLVSLSYAKYRGTAQGNGVSQWLGIRFAAPPTGSLRFRAPQDPLKESSIVEANTHGKVCLSVGGGAPSKTHDEDCLFLDVYAPTAATSSSKLPVYIYIQGGGFVSDSKPNNNGTGLVQASGRNIVVVTFNYRIGPYGFLASSEVVKDGNLNNGLYDQRKVFEWVQKYISQFGGDPKHVVIGGESAGGESVSLHLTAFGGRDDGYFVGAAGESISTPTLRNASQSQFAYDGLVKRSNCTGSDSLACLRKLSATDLQKANTASTPFPGRSTPPLEGYGATIDGDLVQDFTYKLFAQSKFIKVPTILGDDTNGGTIFTPKNTSSYAQCNTFMQNQFPLLTSDQLAKINKLYPVDDFPQDYPNSGPFWRECSQAYGDMRYKCPGTYYSSRLATGNNGMLPTWNYRYNVLDAKQDAEGLGVPHTVELYAIWGPSNVQSGAPSSYYPGGANAAIVPEMQAYWTSFIRTLNPNTHKLKNATTWQQWTGGNQKRILFQVKPSSVMETVSKDDQQRCAYFQLIGPSQQQ